MTGTVQTRGTLWSKILVTITIIGVAATAILLSFATTISGSGEHRNVVTLDTMLRTASAEVTADILQQGSTYFDNCSGASQVNSNTAKNIPLPNANYAATISSVQYESANPAQTYVGTDTYTFSSPQSPPGTSCPSANDADSPQLLTVAVTYSGASGSTTSNIQTVVDDPITPTPGSSCAFPATQLVFVWQPTDGANNSAGTAGTALYPQPAIAVEDQNGCIVQSDFSQVQLAITAGTGPNGAALQNCVPHQQDGTTNFTGCSINEPGTGYELTATDGSLTPATTVPFNVSAGIAAQFGWATQPGQGLGGSPLSTQPIVHILDAQGNLVANDNTTVTLSIANNPANGNLTNCTAQANGGIASFTGCTIDKAGNGYTLVASDAADNLPTSVQSNPFNVVPGPAARLAFTTSPGTSVAGDLLSPQPVVALEDLGGNTTSNDPPGTVTLAISNNTGGATLSGCTETTTAGVATFAGCSINNTGVGYTLTATDGTLTPGVSLPFNVTTPTLASFSVVPSTTTPTAGTAVNVTITALDQAGQPYKAFSGTQTLAFSGPANSPNANPPTYPANVSFTNGVSNPAASVTLVDAQSTQLTVTQGPVTGTSATMTVGPAGASTYTVSGFPNPTTAGAAHSVR